MRLMSKLYSCDCDCQVHAPLGSLRTRGFALWKPILFRNVNSSRDADTTVCGIARDIGRDEVSAARDTLHLCGHGVDAHAATHPLTWW